MSVEEDLSAYFGDYRSDDRDPNWARVKSSLSLGGTVTGTVVRQYPFGVFVDIGRGFPALLLVVRFANADVKPYTDISMYPAVGSELSARICVFNDRDHVFGLTQLEREEMLGEE
jgi:ribosomal protein S1